MRRALTITGVIFLLGCGSSFAQVGPTPGMGATSPLGTMNFNAPSGPVGIPLGATELNTGGISPLAGGTLCPSVAGTAGSSTGMTTSGSGISGPSTGMMTSGSGIAGSSSTSTFDGGGASVGSACVPAATGTGGTSAGTAMTPAAGLGLGTTGSGNTIPLGATEVGTPGESTTIGVPLPSISATPCPGTSAMTGTTPTGTLGSTGTTSINGC